MSDTIPAALFVCVRNSARSQMGEALMRDLAQGKVHVASAGLEPGQVHPLTLKVLSEIGIDHSAATADSVFDRFKNGELYRWVITVCSETEGERCPVFPGIAERLHWDVADPAHVEGTEQEKLAAFRIARDELKGRIEQFLSNNF